MEIILQKLFLVCLSLVIGGWTSLCAQTWPQHETEKTVFQSAAPWRADYDIRADVVMVYGVDQGFEERVAGWRDRGYKVHLMTGISWGTYGDYFSGAFDGRPHYEDSQVDRDGHIVWHGGGKEIPYVIPSPTYLDYIKSLVKRAIDAGVEAIHLEEPEIWARSGYSDGFKSEWERYYGTPWVAQHTSPDATYQSSKLKAHLYLNALKEVFAFAKDYSRKQGKEVKCYVPTHSLLSYSAIDMVSPEADLAQLPDMDGYIAQVWTGTARVPVWYNGVMGERVFENAFLEYGSMASMTAPTGRKVFFLTDPVEDAARTWDDYKRNYQATFVAQLLYPKVADYQVLPWPDRIFLGTYSLEGISEPQPISPEYATQVQIMLNSLNDMPVSTNRVNGTPGIGVLMSNTLMYQRFPTHAGYEDPQLSNYYGIAMPLLKRGIQVNNILMENLNLSESLADIDVLVASYASMKPREAAYHDYLANWVKAGGILIYTSSDTDPFQSVKEWWNTGSFSYDRPSDHLFEKLGLPTPVNVNAAGEYQVGEGYVYVIRRDPKTFVMQSGADAEMMDAVSRACASLGKELVLKNHFQLQRGPYDIAAVMTESVSDSPLELTGSFIDLFDPNLPVIGQKIVRPGEQAFLFNLARSPRSAERQVLVSSARVYEQQNQDGHFRISTIGPTKAKGVMRIALDREPSTITVTSRTLGAFTPFDSEWDGSSKTLWLSYTNLEGGNRINMDFTDEKEEKIVIRPGKLLSPNGDGIHDVWVIDGIDQFPENKVTIYSKNGIKVFEAEGYDNQSVVFAGRNKGGTLSEGTYFFQIDYKAKDAWVNETGYFTVRYER